jgi:tetratricopeptide (TPR) repeat protein
MYANLRKRLIQKAEIICQQQDQTADDLLVDVFKKANLAALGGAIVGGRRTNVRTPAALKRFLEIMLSLPPELSAWLVLWRIGRAIFSFGLPIELQGDIMMAFECANYVLPDRTREAARHLAHALCMMPSLGRARALLKNLGCPVMGRGGSQEDLGVLARQGFLPEDVMGSAPGMTQLGWNMEMRTAVVEELERITPEAWRLFQIDRMLRTVRPALRRWKQVPSSQGRDLLARGIELARADQFDSAKKILDRAAKVDPALLPDVLRNKAWILSREGQYLEASDLCQQALEVSSQ